MHIISVERLSRLTQQILVAVGTPSDLAQAVRESLVGANLAGHDSHGVIRLAEYVAGVRAGRVQPAARATIVAPAAPDPPPMGTIQTSASGTANNSASSRLYAAAASSAFFRRKSSFLSVPFASSMILST